MQFLWFSSNVDGSVSMKFRGEPTEWSDDVKANPVSYTHLTLPTILRV